MVQKYGVCVSYGGYNRDGLVLPPYTVVPITDLQSRLLKTPGRKGSIRNCYVVSMFDKQPIKEGETVSITEPVLPKKEEKAKPKKLLNIFS